MFWPEGSLTGAGVRIVKGKFAGRNLTSPADKRVRPTKEAVRDALLTMLEPELKGARVLDLFAGTGALGLEAISRGAKYADFVEFRPASLHALKANVAALRLLERCRIFKKDAVPWTAMLEADRYDIAFVDPPYESKVLDRILEMWKAKPFARTLAVEHAVTHELRGAAIRKPIGESMLSIFRKKGETRDERRETIDERRETRELVQGEGHPERSEGPRPRRR
jgi:16S rRNA (guanine966-N2)-methyltransferase